MNEVGAVGCHEDPWMMDLKANETFKYSSFRTWVKFINLKALRGLEKLSKQIFHS